MGGGISVGCYRVYVQGPNAQGFFANAERTVMHLAIPPSCGAILIYIKKCISYIF